MAPRPRRCPDLSVCFPGLPISWFPRTFFFFFARCFSVPGILFSLIVGFPALRVFGLIRGVPYRCLQFVVPGCICVVLSVYVFVHPWMWFLAVVGIVDGRILHADSGCLSSPSPSFLCAWWYSTGFRPLLPSCYSNSCVGGGSGAALGLPFSWMCWLSAGSCWSRFPIIPLLSPYCNNVRNLAVSLFSHVS